MKRRYLSFSAYLFLALLLIGWQTPPTASAISIRPLFQTGGTIPFRESVARTDLKNLNRTLRTPRGAVLAYFAALRRSDKAMLQKIISPRLQSHRASVEAKDRRNNRNNPQVVFTNWMDSHMATWKKEAEMILSIGEAPPSTKDGEGVEIIRVPITLDKRVKTKAHKQPSIKVAKYGNIWLWDEN